MSQTQLSPAERLQQSRPVEGSESSHKSLIADPVDVTNWSVVLDQGQLFTQCSVAPKNSTDTIFDISIGVYSSDRKKLFCWGMVGPTYPSTLAAAALDASAATNLYNPETHGRSLIGVVTGDTSSVSGHFHIEKKFTV